MTELEFIEAEIVPDMDAAEARGFVAEVHAVQDAADALVPKAIDAVQRRAWLALGYDGWAAMCEAEGLRLPRDVTAELRAGGLSIRAIAAVTGVSHTQARQDAGGKSGQEDFPPAHGTLGLDGRDYGGVSAGSSASVSNAFEAAAEGGQSRTVPNAETDIRDQRSKRIGETLTGRTHTGEAVPYPKPNGKATFNETTGEGISWAAWSWNPITGCLHGCDYCYARAIAARFTDGFPAGFTPLLREERLDAPTNTSIPQAHHHDPAYRRVFVCSMADLYGRWVPDEWIERVHTSMLAAPWWQYILLTKFPARYAGLELPPGAWIGTSVDEQNRVRIAEDAMRKLDVPRERRWLSLEPLREPLEFTDLSLFGWVVIGAQTETYQPNGTVEAFAPPWPWYMRIALQAHEAGCKVHIKPNLWNGKPGRLPDEYPT